MGEQRPENPSREGSGLEARDDDPGGDAGSAEG
jgi:hypothetical protein